MEQETLRRLIRNKLADGRLPQNSIPRLWGGAGNGETCDACEEVITKAQFVMEGVSTTGGLGIQFHVGCLHIWDAERCAPGRLKPTASDELLPNVQPARAALPTLTCERPDPICVVCGKSILTGVARYRRGLESTHTICEWNK